MLFSCRETSCNISTVVTFVFTVFLIRYLALFMIKINFSHHFKIAESGILLLPCLLFLYSECQNSTYETRNYLKDASVVLKAQKIAYIIYAHCAMFNLAPQPKETALQNIIICKTFSRVIQYYYNVPIKKYTQ